MRTRLYSVSVYMVYNGKKIKTYFPAGILMLVGLVSCQPFFNLLDASAVPEYEKPLETRFVQDAYEYADVYQVDEATQQLYTDRFLELYFSPWADYTLLISDEDISSFVQNSILQYQKYPGWTDYRQPIKSQWVESVVNNINWSGGVTQHRRGISLVDTNLRVLPTIESSFTDWVSAGEGYPFDNLQVSYLPAYTPLIKLHTSADKAWHLVMTRYGGGWVSSRHVADVSAKFIRQWQSGRYIVATHEDKSIYNAQGVYVGHPRLGVLYPIIEKETTITRSESHYQIGLAVSDGFTSLNIMPGNIAKSSATEFPLQMSSKNFAMVMNGVLGKPYGWGGKLGFRDCSSINQDFFSTFGLWVPRHSSMQVKNGRQLSLLHLNSYEKKRFLRKYAIPFLTFVSMPGHMMLYIGDDEGEPMVIHTLWGLKTFSSEGVEGRRVIGRTVITPLDFGRDESGVSVSLLGRASDATLLLPPQAIKY